MWYSRFWIYSAGQPQTLSTIDRIDYSNDTTAAASKGPLSAGRYLLAAVSNGSYGWWAGGNPAPKKSTIDRTDFSNDTATASVRGPLSRETFRCNAMGNNDYGYIAFGDPASSPFVATGIDRIDYSNDTATTSPKGHLTEARQSTGAVTAAENGFPQFGG